MSFLLHLEQIISSMPIDTIASSGKPIVATIDKTLNVNGLSSVSSISSLGRHPMGMDNPQVLAQATETKFFIYLKSKFLLN
jgi:hypothetical protein